MQARQFTLRDRRRGGFVLSNAETDAFDTVFDYLSAQSEPDLAKKRELAHLAFVGKRRPDGGLGALYFCPEYPNETTGALREFMAYLGFRLDRRTADNPFEIPAYDTSYRPLTWAEGMQRLQALDSGAMTQDQRRLVACLRRIDALPKPNGPPDLLRATLPAPGGAHFLFE